MKARNQEFRVLIPQKERNMLVEIEKKRKEKKTRRIEEEHHVTAQAANWAGRGMEGRSC